jgi:O-antigen/teichoic acid export membrane protein
MLGCSATAITAVVVVFRRPVAQVLLGPSDDNELYVAVAAVTLWFSCVNLLPAAYLRAIKRSGLLVSLQVGQMMANIVINVYLLVVVKTGVLGILIGNLIATGLGVVLLVCILRKMIGSYRFDWPEAPGLWRFGTPLIITGLLAVLMQQCDAYFLRAFTSMHDVGVYALASRIAQAINTLLVIPFTAIWSVMIYEVDELRDAKKIFSEIFLHYFNLVCLTVLGISLFAKPIISFIASPEFSEAAQYIPLSALAILIQSLSIHFRTPALLSKKTGRMILPSVAGAAVAVGGNGLLIPFYGIWGAVGTAIVSGIVFSFTSLHVYQRIERFDYPFVKCAVMSVAVLLTYIICMCLQSIQQGIVTTLLIPGAAICIWTAACARTVAPLAFRVASVPTTTGT